MPFCSAPREKGRDMTRRTLYLPALLGTLAAAVLMACAAAVLAASEQAEATFPGKNGRIAYASYAERCRLCIVGYPGHDPEIYTINASGRDKIQLTHNKNEFDLSYSPNGKRIVYAGFPGLEDKAESDIYTINAVGSGKTQVTNTDNAHEIHPSWGSRP